MVLLFWDASALVKRYTPEIGSDVVDALFTHHPALWMATTVWGYAETFSIVLRKLNDGRLDQPTFTASITGLQTEVIDNPDFRFLTVDDAAVLAGISLMQRHNLNAADATILAAVLRYVRLQSPQDPRCILVAADRRLLRSAQAEGLTTLDPESFPAADVASFLAAL
jgi:predicted nucleic acid-binding protein